MGGSMSTFKKFEEIESWQKARILTREIYRASGRGSFSRDFSLKDQIRKASVSMMSNIAEGFERQSRKEFLYFLSISKASGGEVKSQLYVALDQGYVSQEDFEELIELADEASRMIYGLMTYLRAPRLSRNKSHT